MSSNSSSRAASVRYQPDESPPAALAFGCGVQLVILGGASIVLFPAIVVRAADGSEGYLSWAVFGAVAISGVCTALQAVRVGRIGAGYVLAMGPPGAFIGLSAAALAQGGPALLGTLVVASSLLPLVLSTRLSQFRRLLTPTIVGTVNMLIPVTVLPVVFSRMHQTPEQVPALGAPLTALATILVIVGIAFKGTATLRLWAPVIGIATGSLAAGAFGLYDVSRVAEASWVGVPRGGWPGIELDMSPAFVGLLPAFLFVALIGATQTIVSAVAIQSVSWRRPRAVDYRAVEGCMAADGVCKLFSGLAGIMPTQTIAAVSAPAVQLTGVGARAVGTAAGGVLITLAFLPKALATLLAIPGAVAGAYVTVLMALTFVRGMTEIVQGGIDHRKGLVAGVAFFVGTGCQNGMILPELLSDVAGGLLQNGITAGGLVAVLMTLFLEMTAPRRSRIEVDLDPAVVPKVRDFLGAFAQRRGWDAKMVHRLESAGERTLLTLTGPDERGEKSPRRRLFLSAHEEAGGAVLEFVAAVGEENVQDRIVFRAERPEDLMDGEVSLRLLRHIVASVRHQQFHETDTVTVRVEAPERSRAGR